MRVYLSNLLCTITILLGATFAVAQSSSSSQSGQTASPNATLQSHIADALRNEPTLTDSHLGVNVTDRSIDLTGTVGSSQDKQTAERIAQSFDGNRKLNDKITITGHGHSDMAPDHSAINNGGTGNAPNPAMQPNSSNPPQHP